MKRLLPVALAALAVAGTCVAQDQGSVSIPRESAHALPARTSATGRAAPPTC